MSDALMNASTTPSIPRDIQALEHRIAAATADCEAWRRTGNTEKYIEAYDMVEALRSDLEKRTQGPR
jgi:hypothetical protein